MSWRDGLKGDSFSWLMEHESAGVRYLALKQLADLPEGDSRLEEAGRLAHSWGPIADVLANMEPEGYWVKPGAGYGPKYKGTGWSILLLAELGASVRYDARIGTACSYLLDHALADGGQFTHSGAPSGTFDCLQGNMCWALAAMGCEDERLGPAFEWMARSQTGEGIAPAGEPKAFPRYYAYKCGPNFVCGANYGQACAWGAVKVMMAFGVCPHRFRTPLVEDAIRRGVDFFFSVDPATAAYPSGITDHPSSNWWKFGFPVFYVTDLLQLTEALAVLGIGQHPRLTGTLALIREKQDKNGRWKLEYDYKGKTWGEYGKKGLPNPWVTLRALRVLKAAGD